jgi:NAD(P)-dependent dehydrogenase (short-subunit alcohol dehydrogenase family)
MPILDLFRVDRRVAVVTGSGRGIGAAIAVALASAGADVVVTARRAHEVAAVAAEVRALGRRAVEVPGDLREPGMPERLARTAVDELGGLDMWVNNAGGTDQAHVQPLTATTDDQMREMFELNLLAAFAGSREAPRGIRVNAISPGMVPTESFHRVLQFTDDDLPALATTVPLGRLGTPEDMAAAALFLLSPASGWVTGQNLLVGGGRDGGKSVEHR